MQYLCDQNNVFSRFREPPKRVISLVPSITESLFDLGQGASVVGITDYCIYPAEYLSGLPRLGGPKNPDIDQIIQLKPDLIFANQEENTPHVLEKIASYSIPIWLSFPKTVIEVMELLWDIVGIYQSKNAALRLNTLQKSLDWAIASVSEIQTWTYFCPIWQHPTDLASHDQRWWMTFNQYTYMADLLSLFGGKNIFSDRIRRYPLEADIGDAPAQSDNKQDTRYPRVTAEEILSAAPQVVILPDEPFPFNEIDLRTFTNIFAATPAVQNNHIMLVEGSLLTWHGTRLGKALVRLPEVLNKAQVLT
jgi:ABC-type Fe3+-hydroxamate transport system substrate-binding protein